MKLNPMLIVPMDKAFSDSARKAAAEARKRKPNKDSGESFRRVQGSDERRGVRSRLKDLEKKPFTDGDLSELHDRMMDIPPSDFEEESVSPEFLSEEYAKEHGLDPEKLHEAYLKRYGDPRDASEIQDVGQAQEAINTDFKEAFGKDPDVTSDWNNQHDSELFTVYSESGSKKTEDKIEKWAEKLAAKSKHPGVEARGWEDAGGGNRYYVLDVNGLEFMDR